MNKKIARAAAKYVLCQLPGLLLVSVVLFLLRGWSAIPDWLLWVLLGLWVFKDLALFPFVWWIYAPDENLSPMVGRTGEAREKLDPAGSGYVRVRGELWRAELASGEEPADPGTPIRVRGQKGLTLIVEVAAREMPPGKS